MSDFYVYALLDPRKPGKARCPGTGKVLPCLPKYIGKGRGIRAERSANVEDHRFIRSTKAAWMRRLTSEGHEPQLVMLKTNMEEAAAFALERDLIAHFGRKDLKLGPLLNRSHGGEGATHTTDEDRDEYVRLLKPVKGFRLLGRMHGRGCYAKHECKVHGVVETAPCHVMTRLKKGIPPCPRCGETARGPQIRVHRLANGEASYKAYLASKFKTKQYRLDGPYLGAVKHTEHWCAVHGQFKITPSNVRQKLDQGLTPCPACNAVTQRHGPRPRL